MICGIVVKNIGRCSTKNFSQKFCKKMETLVMESFSTKRRSPLMVFSCEFCEILQNNFSIEHL